MSGKNTRTIAPIIKIAKATPTAFGGLLTSLPEWPRPTRDIMPNVIAPIPAYESAWMAINLEMPKK